MYAVIKTGGKQYKVSAGDKIKVEAIAADIGTEITIDQVLAIGAGDKGHALGAPLVQGATVSAKVLDHGRHDKVRIFKMRRRKHYQKRQGHRQDFTELFISGIKSALGEATADAAQSNAKSSARAAIARAAAVAGRTDGAAAGAKRAGKAGQDDLQVIEGIGPKIAELLRADGISTFAQLAETSVEHLQGILTKAGSRFATHNPGTWPEQAALAAKGDWDTLQTLQDQLDGGVRK